MNEINPGDVVIYGSLPLEINVIIDGNLYAVRVLESSWNEWEQFKLKHRDNFNDYYKPLKRFGATKASSPTLIKVMYEWV